MFSFFTIKPKLTVRTDRFTGRTCISHRVQFLGHRKVTTTGLHGVTFLALCKFCMLFNAARRQTKKEWRCPPRIISQLHHPTLNF